ncbi:MAG TPA: hypothetical protein VLM41_07530 [Steroidobacteraceae bacterium]|nr:hypothetical protein [Steroidobacteraceae bacterium]
MNAALTPFNHEEFLQFRAFLTRLLDHLVSMTPAEPAESQPPPRAAARKSARGKVRRRPRQ